MNLWRIFFLLGSLLISSLLFAQNVTISGTVKSINEKPIEDASVYIDTSRYGTKTNSNGWYEIKNIKPGSYILKASTIGYEVFSKEVKILPGTNLRIDIQLVEQNKKLDEVTVVGLTGSQKASRTAIKTEVIDTKASQQRAATLIELMNRSAGIRIRQSGGMGSNNDIMLNGFQGKSVRMFKDGIPTDYLGVAFSIGNVPSNTLDRVEVYKGVLPVSLGADALGGAVNLVSRNEGNRYLALSYEAASFNTHRATLNTKYTSVNSKFFAGADAFINYSKNNYSVIADVVDTITANVVPTKVKLFHYMYKQYYGEIYGGLQNLSWADELRLGLTAFYIYRQNQFAAVMERPFGAAYGQQYANIIPSLRYKKKLFHNKISIDQFLVYSKIHSLDADTLQGSYDWFGKYHAPANAGQRGERGVATFAKTQLSNFTSRSNIGFYINDNHKADFNVVFNNYSRKGTDPYGPVTPGANPVDLLSLPENYRKLVASLGMTSSFLNKKIENVFQVKYFGSNASGKAVNVSTGKPNDQVESNKISRFGAGEAIKYNFNVTTFIRASAEMATRLPDQAEIFGNGAFALSNFSITPEKSVNGNLGFRTGSNGKYTFEVNGFYRITKDMIVSVPVNFLYSQSVNVEQVRGIGLETDATYRPLKWLQLNGNFTYQSFRLYKIKDPILRYLEGARLRNVPYFFANLGANTSFSKVFTKNDKIQAYWYYSYIHQYYLNYIPKDTEPDGFLELWGKAKVNSPLIIPSQQLHTAGITWYPNQAKSFSIGAEVKNIFNEKLYDNFKIQNAARSFHVKLNYFFKS